MQETVLNTFVPRPWWKRWWGIILTLFFGFVVIFGAWFAYQVYASVQKIKSGAAKPLTAYAGDFTSGTGNAAGAAQKNAPLIRPENVSVGDEKSQNTIVEFGDFECPFTAKEFPIIRSIMTHMTGVRFVYRDYPLTSVHARAADAALAAACAKAQGKYWEYHDQLFLNQNDLSPTALQQYAKVVGLDAAAFSSCMDNKTFKDQILRDAQDGYALGVRGTPTFFINGIKVEGAIPADGWVEIFKRIGAKLLP